MPISQRAVVATARAGAFSMRSAAEQSVESIMHLLAMLAVAYALLRRFSKRRFERAAASR